MHAEFCANQPSVSLCTGTVHALSFDAQEGAAGVSPRLLLGLLNSEQGLLALPEADVSGRVQQLAATIRRDYEGALEMCGSTPVVTFPLRGKTISTGLDSGTLYLPGGFNQLSFTLTGLPSLPGESGKAPYMDSSER